MNMTEWQRLLLWSLAACVPLLAVLSSVRKYRRRRDRDFTRRLETVLKPKEEIKAVCPEKEGHWILTNERLLLEQGEGFLAIPFSKVKKVTGTDKDGKATVAAGKMEALTVKSDADHILHRRGAEFETLVKGLKAGVARFRRKTAKSPKKAAGKPGTTASKK